MILLPIWRRLQLARRRRTHRRQFDALSIHAKAAVIVRAIAHDKTLRRELRRALERREKP